MSVGRIKSVLIPVNLGQLTASCILSMTLLSHDTFINNQWVWAAAVRVWVRVLFVPWSQSSDHLDHSVNLPKPTQDPPSSLPSRRFRRHFAQLVWGGFLFFLSSDADTMSLTWCLHVVQLWIWQTPYCLQSLWSLSADAQTPVGIHTHVGELPRRNFSDRPSSCWPVNPSLWLLS